MDCLIALDKFKGALGAADACAAAAAAVSAAAPGARVVSAPLADGGEGFAAIVGSALGGELREAEVRGPLFRPVKGRYALVEAARIPRRALERLNLHAHATRGLVAFVEMSSASGYECLQPHERDPWKTTTMGTGELMRAAAAAGAGAVILGIGGSATNDCGAGALEALGVLYYDKELQPVRNVVPETFRRIHTLGATSHLLGAFPPVRIACDVTNPLAGPHGATRVYGPQKGLKPEDAERMDRVVRKMGMHILGLFGRHPSEWDRLLAEPGSGAAGGIGFALRHALPDTAFVEGFPLVADLLDLPGKVRAAGLVITGEGRLDASSLSGKGPVGLVRMAGEQARVLLFAGSADPDTVRELQQAHPNLRVVVISDPAWPLAKALAETASSLRAAVRAALQA